MIEIKFFIMMLIIIISSYIGFIKANSFSEREKEIKNILSALKYMRNKIEFTNLHLREIFEEISENIYKQKVHVNLEKYDEFENKSNIFKDSIKSNLSIKNSFIEAVNKNKKLDLDDKNILNNFALSLGKLDRKIQISEIDIAYNFMVERLKDAEDQKVKNVKMYKTLGVTCGLIISIILI